MDTRWDPTPCPRLQDWTAVERAIDADTVDAGFDAHHPKEPAACHHRGRFLVACAVWSGYVPADIDKEVVLCAADDPAGPFEQVSRVTDNPGTYMHAPAVLAVEGELWVFVSDKTGGENSVRARHAPLDAIPAAPAGWTDEGVVADGARDPGIVRGPEGYHLFVTDERGPGVARLDSPDLRAWGDRTTVHPAGGEAPDAIPQAAGDGYWLVTADSGEPRHSVAAEGSLAGEFADEYVVGTHRGLNGHHEPFHAAWTLHHDYCFAAGGRELHREDGAVLAYFEGGDGEQFSVGVASAPAE
ncbi:MAG: hypothetical protein ABEH77_03135 [Halobacteriaceae archaeon]